MPKKGKGKKEPAYNLVHRARFQYLLDEGKQPTKIGGFKLKPGAVNNLWRWDTLQDVKI